MKNKTLVPAFLYLALFGCGGATADAPPPTIAPKPARARLCSAPMPGVFGAFPLKNKTRRDVDVQATDDLLITAMVDTGCFTLAERDKVDVLINEMKLCDTDNPDHDFFDCKTFAQKGKLLGVTDMMLGDVILAEPSVRGAEIHARVPWIGGLSMNQSYAAVAVSLRLVHVETGKVLASTNVSAVVPSIDAGIDVSGKSFNLGATAHSHTPMGQALGSMIDEGVRRLQKGE